MVIDSFIIGKNFFAEYLHHCQYDDDAEDGNYDDEDSAIEATKMVLRCPLYSM